MMMPSSGIAFTLCVYMPVYLCVCECIYLRKILIIRISRTAKPEEDVHVFVCLVVFCVHVPVVGPA